MFIRCRRVNSRFFACSHRACVKTFSPCDKVSNLNHQNKTFLEKSSSFECVISTEQEQVIDENHRDLLIIFVFSY